MPLQLADLHLNQDATRPVQAALSRACLDNFNAAIAAVSSAMAVGEQSATMPYAEAERRVKEFVEVALQSLTTTNELMDWVYPPGRPMPFPEAFSNAQALQKWGADSDHIQAILSGLQKGPVGRPHQHQSYIKAFEFQLQSKKNSQGQATRKFCPCGGKAHTARCEQNLKAGMRSLKKVLRKYAPELVLRYESLHPDRAKKVNG